MTADQPPAKAILSDEAWAACLRAVSLSPDKLTRDQSADRMATDRAALRARCAELEAKLADAAIRDIMDPTRDPLSAEDVAEIEKPWRAKLAERDRLLARVPEPLVDDAKDFRFCLYCKNAGIIGHKHQHDDNCLWLAIRTALEDTPRG